MEIALTIVSYLVAAAVGAFAWTKVSPLVQKELSARAAKSAVANAKAVLAAEEKRVAALAAARAAVAAAPATSATGVSGPTGPAA